MECLKVHAEKFESTFPLYSDARYGAIAAMLEGYSLEEVRSVLSNDISRKLLTLVKPIIAIKNYKSQIPFPENIEAVVERAFIIKSVKPNCESNVVLKGFSNEFDEFLGFDGFQLPTVSAIFHFCHPDHFPIVDTYVEAACGYLGNNFPCDFSGLEIPSLPRPLSSNLTKRMRYEGFIKFINRIKSLQADCCGKFSYRDIDKALMVLGKREKAKEKRERERQNVAHQNV